MSGGGFFALDLNVCDYICKDGGSYNELAAYVVLASHTNGLGKNAHEISTAGAKAVSKRVGIGYRRAEAVLEYLVDRGVIVSVRRSLPTQKPLPKQREPRYRLEGFSLESSVYLPHSFVHGIEGSRPPLATIRSQSALGPLRDVSRARIDTLRVFLELCRHDSMVDFGGIAPNALYQRWEEADDDPIEAGDIQFKPMVYDGSEFTTTRLINKIFGESEDSSKRFWFAIHQLKKFSLIYEVLQVWDSDPTGNIDAEILYPLYVFNKTVSDPHLSREVNRVVQHFLDYPDQELFFREEGIQFYYPSTTGKEVVLSSFRFRFRGKTDDVGKGIDSQKGMVDRWSSLLRQIDTNEYFLEE